MIKARIHAILLGLLALPLAAAAGGGKAKPRGPVHPVNLNTATVTELMQLPKVGAKTAERIVAWRKEHGGFRRPEEVMHVKGIGEKGFQRIKGYLKVAGAASEPLPVRVPTNRKPAGKSGAAR
ncbi:MAG TPA: helix-hairpin-helix domain-containing protein [Holophagaceae bacterium]|nr:helix-hairpin-helix domain-containing protein [Holophagaceae bacterium]